MIVTGSAIYDSAHFDSQRTFEFVSHLFNMASFIFNNLLQSPLKRIAQGTQNSIQLKAKFQRTIPAAIWPSDSRENHEKLDRPCSRGWTTQKSLEDSGPGFLRASVPCWWIPGWGPEFSVGSFLSHVRAPSLAGRSKGDRSNLLKIRKALLNKW